MNMNHHLENYSKIKFHGDLDNLERDVKRRMKSRHATPHGGRNFIEEWFGVPLSMGVSAVASMMILGVFLGLQMQTEVPHTGRDTLANHNIQGHDIQADHDIQGHDVLGLEVFSATNARLPSSMLAAKL